MMIEASSSYDSISCEVKARHGSFCWNVPWLCRLKKDARLSSFTQVRTSWFQVTVGRHFGIWHNENFWKHFGFSHGVTNYAARFEAHKTPGTTYRHLLSEICCLRLKDSDQVVYFTCISLRQSLSQMFSTSIRHVDKEILHSVPGRNFCPAAQKIFSSD